MAEKNSKHHAKLLSIAQDIVFLVTSGKTLTPKHVGLGITVHQATRSKDLVQLLHAAGHSVSYDTIRRIDTSIANDVIERSSAHGNITIPSNFSEDNLQGYVRYANDNIDINEETLDGKGTFHASQTAAFRQGNPDGEPKNQTELKLGRARGLVLPPDYQQLRESGIGKLKPEPNFQKDVESNWYDPSKESLAAAKAKDIAWILCKLQDEERKAIPSWSGFNQKISTSDKPKTVIGHMPIINAPAHDNDVIWTVMQNCMGMTSELHQKYTIITFDEQLYCKAKMLQWHRQDECENTIIILGGFHVQLNFSKFRCHSHTV